MHFPSQVPLDDISRRLKDSLLIANLFQGKSKMSNKGRFGSTCLALACDFLIKFTTTNTTLQNDITVSIEIHNNTMAITPKIDYAKH